MRCAFAPYGEPALAVVPVPALAVGIGPVPAQVGRRTPRHISHRGHGDERAESYAGNDGAVVGPPDPGPPVPVRTAGPARRTVPMPGAAPTRLTVPARERARPRGPAPIGRAIGARRPVLNALDSARI